MIIAFTRRQGRLALLLVTALVLTGCGRLVGCGRQGPPYGVNESLKTFEIEPGFRVEPFVTEPAISSPVAMEWDEFGRIYVVEMPGYPLDTSPSGRVKMLEDTNGDGRPDRVTVFADELVLPTGVMRWKNGILVTAAPDLLYFEDTNGDGRADVRRVVLTGFPFTNPQHSVSTPIYGLDNWIYLAAAGGGEAIIYKDLFADQGQELRFPDRPEAPGVHPRRQAVRVRPDTYEVEALASRTQFGHAFDQWGRYLVHDNSNHVRHEAIAARYLARNPDLLVQTAMQNVPEHGGGGQVFPITENPQFEMLTEVGQFTSACALTMYLGGAFPAEYEHVTFVAEPVHNLVHADRWSPAGPTFVARRLREDVEFLAARDAWFRPVNFSIGPDGALYMLDYYRQFIEHPEWGGTHHHHDPQHLYRGQDRGRLYRIVPEGGLALPANVRLGHASTEELVDFLGHVNVWWRRHAQRLLVDRQDPRAVELLTRVVRERPSALARLHALWTLEGLGSLEPKLLLDALADPEPGVRENAIVLSEPFLETEPALVEQLLGMGADPDGRVRFQLLCTLGFIESPASRDLQHALLVTHLDDRWMQAAALSASSDRAAEYFDLAATRRADFLAVETPARAEFFRQVGAVIGARGREAEIRRTITTVAEARGPDWWQGATLEGLARGAGRSRPDRAVLGGSGRALLTLVASASPAVRQGALDLLEVAGLPEGFERQQAIDRAIATAEDRQADAEARADAIRLLMLTGSAAHAVLFRQLVGSREPEVVQAAAVRALGRTDDEEVGPFLIGQWRGMTRPVRAAAADALLTQPDRARLLVAALQDEIVQPWTLDFWEKRRLLMNRDPEIRQAAREILEEKPGEREAVVERYRAALHADADPARGAAVFREVCARCHVFDGEGVEVGPDLGTVRNRPAELLLVDILMPSRSIAPQYETYVVERISGGFEQGVLGTQTPEVVVLRKEEGHEVVIPRHDIRQMYFSNLSAMPPDLDQQIDQQQMADLIAFIRRGGN
jgi:putative membrane-bound dehydrogenase-like protein